MMKPDNNSISNITPILQMRKLRPGGTVNLLKATNTITGRASYKPGSNIFQRWTSWMTLFYTSWQWQDEAFFWSANLSNS